MNTREIERSLREDVQRDTPYILDRIKVELELDSREDPAVSGMGLEAATETFRSRRSRPTRPLRRLIVLPVALILLVLGILHVAQMRRQAYAIVGLDVNPSIEITVSRDERVLCVSPLNDDSSHVLEDLSLEGTDLYTACHAVVGSLLVKGYLRQDANSLLVSVRAIDRQRGTEMEQRLVRELDYYLEDSQVVVAILGQYVEDSETLARFAAEHDISLGKALLIQKLLAGHDSKMDEASLLKLSTQELILLAQEHHVEAETSMGASDTSGFIAREEALRISLEDSGVGQGNATHTSVEFECEDGIIVYEVEFDSSRGSFDYVIDASSGRILSAEREVESDVLAPYIDIADSGDDGKGVDSGVRDADADGPDWDEDDDADDDGPDWDEDDDLDDDSDD